MKRRWTILFFAALSPLIGWSWLASSNSFSMWNALSIQLLTQLAAAAVAGYAAVKVIPTKTPAYVVIVLSLPSAWQMLKLIPMFSQLRTMMGPSMLLVVLGSFIAIITGSVIAASALPKPPVEPQVAPARVVD